MVEVDSQCCLLAEAWGWRNSWASNIYCKNTRDSSSTIGELNIVSVRINKQPIRQRNDPRSIWQPFINSTINLTFTLQAHFAIFRRQVSPCTVVNTCLWLSNMPKRHTILLAPNLKAVRSQLNYHTAFSHGTSCRVSATAGP